MKKKLIQVTSIFCLCLVSVVGFDLFGTKRELLSAEIFGDAIAQAQVYEACPGGDISFVHPVSSTITCAHGGNMGIIPHFDDYTYTECVDADSCCPISGFDDPPTCD